MHCTIWLVLLLTTVTSSVLTSKPIINYSKLDNLLKYFSNRFKNLLDSVYNRCWQSAQNIYKTKERAYDIIVKLNATLFLHFIKEAKLDSILKNPQSRFTIFAPTNENLEKLPDKIKQNSTLMDTILRFHLVSGYEMSSCFINNKFIKTLAKYGIPPNRRPLYIRTNIYNRLSSNILTVSGSKVLSQDHTNGLSVVHLIDGLMFPLPEENAYNEIFRQPKFSILRGLVKKSLALIRVLSNSNRNLTIFAPTDEAFKNLPDGTLQKLKNNVPLLTQTLVLGFVSNVYYNDSFMDGMNLSGISQNTIQMTFNHTDVVISYGKAEAVVTDIDLSVLNGVIHGINNILLIQDNPETSIIG